MNVCCVVLCCSIYLSLSRLAGCLLRLFLFMLCKEGRKGVDSIHFDPIDALLSTSSSFLLQGNSETATTYPHFTYLHHTPSHLQNVIIRARARGWVVFDWAGLTDAVLCMSMCVYSMTQQRSEVKGKT